VRSQSAIRPACRPRAEPCAGMSSPMAPDLQVHRPTAGADEGRECRERHVRRQWEPRDGAASKPIRRACHQRWSVQRREPAGGEILGIDEDHLLPPGPRPGSLGPTAWSLQRGHFIVGSVDGCGMWIFGGIVIGRTTLRLIDAKGVGAARPWASRSDRRIFLDWWEVQKRVTSGPSI
jgi:hypothetical protein